LEKSPKSAHTNFAGEAHTQKRLLTLSSVNPFRGAEKKKEILFEKKERSPKKQPLTHIHPHTHTNKKNTIMQKHNKTKTAKKESEKYNQNHFPS